MAATSENQGQAGGERAMRINDGHLYLDAADGPNVYTPYERRLHVSRALNPNGLHIDVQIVAVHSGETQRGGINLTVDEAATLVGHIGRVLAEVAADA